MKMSVIVGNCVWKKGCVKVESDKGKRASKRGVLGVPKITR